MKKFQIDYVNYDKEVTELLDRNIVPDDNVVSIIEIGNFLIEQDEDANFEKLKELCNYMLTDFSYDLDCDMITNGFIELYNSNRDETMKLLETDTHQLYSKIDEAVTVMTCAMM